jgi:hypothetical protein
MHCPACGAQSPIDHKFCRSCGMDLQVVSATLAVHLSTAGQLSAAEAARLRRAEAAGRMRKFSALMLALFVTGMGAMGIGALAFHGTVLPGFVILLSGLLIYAYGLLFSAFSRGSRPSPVIPRTNPLPGTDRTIDSSAPEIEAPATSVTERTTQLIDS